MYSKLLGTGLIWLVATATAHQEHESQKIIGEEEQAELIRKWDFEVGSFNRYRKGLYIF
jgi:hypothetical protein